MARNFLKFGSNGLKRVRSVMKLDTKCLKPGSGLTLAEMSRVRNVLYYDVDSGETDSVTQSMTTRSTVTKSNMAAT